MQNACYPTIKIKTPLGRVTVGNNFNCAGVKFQVFESMYLKVVSILNIFQNSRFQRNGPKCVKRNGISRTIFEFIPIFVLFSGMSPKFGHNYFKLTVSAKNIDIGR